MKLNVTLTSDFICPWCLIGEKRLFDAIESLPADLEVEVHWRPYELNPEMPVEGLDRRAYRSAKFGSWDRSQVLDADTVAAGRPDGVAFDYDRIERTPNTHRAHRLSWLARREGLQTELARAILEGYFAGGKDIGDIDTLVALAEQAGMKTPDLREFLEGTEGTDEVRAQEAEALRSEVRGVPSFDIEGTVVGGALRTDLLRTALLEVAEKKKEAATGLDEEGNGHE